MSSVDRRSHEGNKVTSLRAAIKDMIGMMGDPKCSSNPVLRDTLKYYQNKLEQYNTECLTNPQLRLEMIEDLRYQIAIHSKLGLLFKFRSKFEKQLTELESLPDIDPTSTEQLNINELKAETTIHNATPPGGIGLSIETWNFHRSIIKTWEKLLNIDNLDPLILEFEIHKLVMRKHQFTFDELREIICLTDDGMNRHKYSDKSLEYFKELLTCLDDKKISDEKDNNAAIHKNIIKRWKKLLQSDSIDLSLLELEMTKMVFMKDKFTSDELNELIMLLTPKIYATNININNIKVKNHLYDLEHFLVNKRMSELGIDKHLGDLIKNITRLKNEMQDATLDNATFKEKRATYMKLSEMIRVKLECDLSIINEIKK